MTYRIGPGPAKVHLKVKSNWDMKTMYDVIAKLPGIIRSGSVDHSRKSSRRLGEWRGRSDFRLVANWKKRARWAIW